MADKAGTGGYRRRSWTKLLAIYVAVAAASISIVYLLFFAGGGGSGGGGVFGTSGAADIPLAVPANGHTSYGPPASCAAAELAPQARCSPFRFEDQFVEAVGRARTIRG